MGNGGFSLRSRKLLQALQDPRIELHGAEDETICRRYRPLLEEAHGIVFASEAMADAFAFEAAYPIGRPFGFHGLYNFCRVMPPDELALLVASFTPAIARSPQLLQLGRNCLALGQWQPAAAIFRCILAQAPGHAEATAGLATASANAAVAPPAGRNEACPCGSGKRYKHCHGAAAGAKPPPGPSIVHSSSRRSRCMSAAKPMRRWPCIGRCSRCTPTARPRSTSWASFTTSAATPCRRCRCSSARWRCGRRSPSSATTSASPSPPSIATTTPSRQYRAALALKPDHAAAWNNLGLAFQAQNEVRAGIDAFRRALALKPAFARRAGTSRWRCCSTASSPRAGRNTRSASPCPNWAAGGPACRVRSGTASRLPARPCSFPSSRASATPSSSCATQSARRRRARCVIVAVRTRSQPCWRASAVSPGSVRRASAAAVRSRAPLLSLARAFGTTPATFRAECPTSRPPAERRPAAATAQLGRRRGRGAHRPPLGRQSRHANDRHVRCARRAARRAGRTGSARWHGREAQLGNRSRRASASPQLPDHARRRDFVDTAALLSPIDLVICVDTGIAHLAGAWRARPGCCCLCRRTGAGSSVARTAPGIRRCGCSASRGGRLGRRGGRGAARAGGMNADPKPSARCARGRSGPTAR